MFESYKIIEETDPYGNTVFVPEFSSFLCLHDWKFINKNGVIGPSPTRFSSSEESLKAIEKHKFLGNRTRKTHYV